MSHQDHNNPTAGSSQASNDKCSPELLGLLGELGSQEDRLLLKGLENWREPQQLKAQDLLQKNSPWLSNLEKHILAVHRDELGLLFHDACLRKLLTFKRAAGWTMFLNPVDRLDPTKPKDEASWRQAAYVGRERVATISELSDPLDVVDLLLQPSSACEVSLLTIAEAGYLVRPSETLQMYVAHGVEAAGDLEEAARRFRAVYEQPCSDRNRLVAAGDMGRLALHDGRMPEALRWYELGATGAELYPIFVCSWAYGALQDGNKQSWREAVAVLENQYDPKDPSIDDYCQRLVAGRLSGGWALTAKAAELVHRIDPGGFLHVQKIHNAFL